MTATYDDIVNLPEHIIGEILDGELVTTSMFGFRHAVARSALIVNFGEPEGWWAFHRVEVHLDDHVLVPDFCGWRHERVPKFPDVAWMELPPDWVCGVISLSADREERLRRWPIYAAYGVPHAWLIDPLQKTLEVFRLVDGRWRTVAMHSGYEVVRVAPFEEIEWKLGSLWLD
jgi:Uma2 family endonuclease